MKSQGSSLKIPLGLGPSEAVKVIQKLGLTFHFEFRAEKLGLEVGLGFCLGATEPLVDFSSAWKVKNLVHIRLKWKRENNFFLLLSDRGRSKAAAAASSSQTRSRATGKVAEVTQKN